MRTLRFLLFLAISMAVIAPVSAQLGGLMNKLKKEVVNRVTGTSSGTVQDPSCATDDAVVVYQFAKNEKIVMNEISVFRTSKGVLLIQNKMSKDYYAVVDGKQTGPFKEGDPALDQFGFYSGQGEDSDDVTIKFKGYVFKQGNRFVIRFDGKTYGPYDEILSFIPSANMDKFVAAVYEKMIKESDFGDMSKYQKEMDNAKTEAEKTRIAMQMSQQLSSVMMEKGGMSTGPTVVSNIPDVTWNPVMANISNEIKYNEILQVTQFDIKDLQGNSLYTFKNQQWGMYEKYWLSSDNKRFVGYSSGKITFSDGKEINELFSPYLDQKDGKITLNYLYFSPVKEAIMKVSLPF